MLSSNSEHGAKAFMWNKKESKRMFLTFVLTVATLAVQSLLKAGCSVHTWLAAWNHDLVGVGFCAGEGSRAGRDYHLSRDTSPSPMFRLIRTMWGCRPASACCPLLQPSAVSTKRKRFENQENPGLSMTSSSDAKTNLLDVAVCRLPHVVELDHTG